MTCDYILNDNGGKISTAFEKLTDDFKEDDIIFIKELIDVPADVGRDLILCFKAFIVYYICGNLLFYGSGVDADVPVPNPVRGDIYDYVYARMLIRNPGSSC